jgi:hypothetical protein
MQLAAMYFEVSPDDKNASIEQEIRRVMKQGTDLRGDIYIAFARELYEYYDKMKDSDQ